MRNRNGTNGSKAVRQINMEDGVIQKAAAHTLINPVGRIEGSAADNHTGAAPDLMIVKVM